jgi:hypothetical protein
MATISAALSARLNTLMKSHIAWRDLTPRINTRNLGILSAAMVIFIFLVQGNAGFNLQDEGFLWYGTIRTALGEVPLRDFQGYEPGRYYWGAIWFKLLRNDGILALRVSQAIFQFLGLTIAFLLLRRVLRSWLALVVAGVVLLMWMFPPWKIYEPVITIVAVYFAVLLIESHTEFRHLLAGMFIGLAAVFGRNHGLYCFGAFLLLILFIWWKIDRGALVARLAAWSLGIVIGYLPMLLMLAFIPGFFGSFVEGISSNLNQGTNLPLPVPWPWVPNYSVLSARDCVHVFSVGALYITLPLLYLVAGVTLLLKSKLHKNTLLTACIFVGAVYLHYDFVRPHLYYLAWTIPPLLLGLIALPSSFSERNKKRLTVFIWSFLLVMSWNVAQMAPENFFLMKARGWAKAKLMGRYHGDVGLAMQDYFLVETDIRGDKLWIRNEIAGIVNNVKALNNDLIPASDNILVAPYWTALYPILQKPSPLWEIYFLFPQSLNRQQGMVEELERKHVNWAIVCDFYLDDRPELAFQNTHGYVWQYLVANFETIETDQTRSLPIGCEVLHRIAPRPSAQVKSVPSAAPAQ